MQRQNRLSAPGWRRCGSTVPLRLRVAAEFTGAVRRHRTTELRNTGIPRGPSLAFRAIHLVLRLRKANRIVAVKYLALRIGREMGALCAHGEKKILCRSPIVSVLQISPCYLKRKRDSKGVETLVSIPLPHRECTANSCAPQSIAPAIKAQKIPQEKTSAGFIILFQQAFLRDLTPRGVQIHAGASGERNAW